MMQALLTLGILGTVVFVATFLIDGATRPGYRPMRHAVSALALGPRGWIQTANFVVCGALITAAAPGVHLAGGGMLLAAAIAAFGLGLVASGVYPMDPMRGYPPGTVRRDPKKFSPAHVRHDWAGVVVFAALPLAAVIAGFALDSTAWSIYSWATGAAMVAFFVWFGAAWEKDHPRTGLIQRGMIVTGWAWLALLCWHLMQVG